MDVGLTLRKSMVGGRKATIGLLENLSQSNRSADIVDLEDRFKFVDDLSLLEIVNLLTVGITSFNLKQSIPSDIPCDNQFIPSNNLQSQGWLDNIDRWTEGLVCADPGARTPIA